MPYTLDNSSGWVDIFSDGWSDVGTSPIVAWMGSGNITSWSIPTAANATIIIEKTFDLSNISSLSISYDVLATSSENYNVDFKIFIDGVLTPINLTGNNLVNTMTIINTSSFTSTSVIRIEIDYTTTAQNSTFLIAVINSLSMSGQVITSINETNYKSNLDIYSYEKSVFITSDEFENVNLMVYNLNGQIVKSDKLNLSTSRTEVKLNDLNTGMYIIAINDGENITRNKIHIQ